MTPLLAVTIDNSTCLFGLGAVVLVASFFIDKAAGKWVAILGVACLFGGFILKSPEAAPYPNPAPAPNPGPFNPNPNPYNPNPTPAPMNFATGVVEAFRQDGGTKDDAVVISAMFEQFASSLEYDGLQQPPRIATANDLGKSFARLQQYRYLSTQTPMGQKFPKFETFISEELARAGLNTGALDSTKRTNAVYLFRTVSNSIRGY